MFSFVAIMILLYSTLVPKVMAGQYIPAGAIASSGRTHIPVEYLAKELQNPARPYISSAFGVLDIHNMEIWSFLLCTVAPQPEGNGMTSVELMKWQ